MNWMTRLILIALFLVSWYFVELGPYGTREVAKYNEGYGTFDMKKYGVEDVWRVLGKMEETGLHVYRMYYLFDFIFVIFFGAVQCMLLLDLYRAWKHPVLFGILCLVPVFRGLFDCVENGILLHTLYHVETIRELPIRIASFCTQCKLWMIRVWILEVLIGMIGRGRLIWISVL